MLAEALPFLGERATAGVAVTSADVNHPCLATDRWAASNPTRADGIVCINDSSVASYEASTAIPAWRSP